MTANEPEHVITSAFSSVSETSTSSRGYDPFEPPTSCSRKDARMNFTKKDLKLQLQEIGRKYI